MKETMLEQNYEKPLIEWPCIIYPVDVDCGLAHLPGLPGLTMCDDLPFTDFPPLGGRIYTSLPAGVKKCKECYGDD